VKLSSKRGLQTKPSHGKMMKRTYFNGVCSHTHYKKGCT